MRFETRLQRNIKFADSLFIQVLIKIKLAKNRFNLLTELKFGWRLLLFLSDHECDTQYQTNELQHLLSLDNIFLRKMEMMQKYQIFQKRLLNSLNWIEQLNKFQFNVSYLYKIYSEPYPQSLFSGPQSAIRSSRTLHTIKFAIFLSSLFCRLTLNIVH